MLGIIELFQGLGTAIRTLRTEQGLSQAQLGSTTAVHRNYIGGIERAERTPSIGAIVAIAQGLGVPTSELFRLAEEQPKSP